MGRRRKYYVEGNVEITGFAAEGKAFGKINNKIVFVAYAAPGDVVDVRITRNKSSFLEGRIERIIQKSALRQEPFCSHFGVCGGCRWQHIPYEKQLEYKHNQVIDQLKHLGQIVPDVVNPILGSEQTKYYRNKLEFTFSPKGWLTTEQLNSGDAFTPALGFHVPGQFDRVLDIDTCYLQDDISNKIRHSIKKFAIEKGIPFHNLTTHEGLLRTMTIRITTTGEIMLIIMLFRHDEEVIQSLKEFVFNDLNIITSLIFIVNTKLNDSFEGLSEFRTYGSEFITENIDGLSFRIGPLSFFQTNSRQAVTMYRAVKDMCRLKGDEIVYDLYTGTGTIANYLAKHCKKVVGIEFISEAVEHARINSEVNGINNAVFVSGDMKDILKPEFFNENGYPDVIVTDPPRAGMHPAVVETLLHSGINRIVYVSCNPATQARDMKILSEKYKVTEVQPIDMFPHTYHVENIALLERLI